MPASDHSGLLEGQGQAVTITRQLPRGAVPRVAVGQPVRSSDVLATLALGVGPLRRFDCAGRLGVEPGRLAEFLLVTIGEPVGAGQALASRVLFETPLVIPSPGAGRVTLISNRLGLLYFRELPPDTDQPVTVNLSLDLGLAPRDALRWLRSKSGDRVRRGQPLAGTSSPYFGSRYSVSPVDGTIASVDGDQACLTITPAPCRLEIPALVEGTVREVVSGRHVRIEVGGRRFPGVFGVGGPVSGELVLPRTNGNDPGDLDGKVALAQDQPKAAELRALEESGVRAVIATTMDEADLADYLGKELRVGITAGGDGSRMTIVLLGGFPGCSDHERPDPPGTGSMAALSALVGRTVYVDGRTQVRAGARRPEVIVLSDPVGGAGLRPPESDGASRAVRAEENPRSAVEAPPIPRLPAGRPMQRTLAGWLSPRRPDRPHDRWLYPCCRPVSAEAYARRFPAIPSPHSEPAPGDGIRSRFVGLPVLEGRVAESLGALATRLAPELAGRLPDIAVGTDAGRVDPLIAFWVLAGALVPELRRVERASGGWAERSEVQRQCPGFILTSEAAATVLRAVPTSGGVCFVVPLGKAYGIEPWHLDLLARGDVAEIMAAIGPGGQVTNLSHGFTILSALGLVRPSADHRTGRVSLVTAEMLGAEVPGYARRLSLLMAPQRAVVDALVDDLSGGRDGPGDLREAFYACLVDATMRECMRQGLLPAPAPLPPFEEFLKGVRQKKVWLSTSHVPIGSAMQTSNSWPMDDMSKPLACGPEGG